MLKIKTALLALTISCLASGVSGQGVVETPPPIRDFDLSTIERLGVEIYRQDQLAWRATDLVMARHPELRAQSAGWVIGPYNGGERVRFLRQTQAGLEAAYDVEFAPNSSPAVVEPADRRLTVSEEGRFRAQKLALSRPRIRCGEAVNTVTLPDPDGGNWLVWVLAATTQPDRVVMGVHYRFTISNDGSTVLGQDALSRACMVMPVEKNAEALVVTGIVSALPVETQVFLSLQHRKPMFVMTGPDKLWAVEGPRIRDLSALLKKAP